MYFLFFLEYVSKRKAVMCFLNGQVNKIGNGNQQRTTWWTKNRTDAYWSTFKSDCDTFVSVSLYIYRLSHLKRPTQSISERVSSLRDVKIIFERNELAIVKGEIFSFETRPNGSLWRTIWFFFYEFTFSLVYNFSLSLIELCSSLHHTLLL